MVPPLKKFNIQAIMSLYVGALPVLRRYTLLQTKMKENLCIKIWR